MQHTRRKEMPRLPRRWLSVGLATMVGATAYSLSASAGDGHHAKGPAPLKCADLAAAILDNQGNHDLFQVAFPGKGRDAGPRSRVLAAKSVVIPAGVEPPPFLGGPPGAPYPSYCEVNLTQFPAINVRVEPRTPPTFAVARSLPVATNVPCSGQHPTDMTAPKKKRIGGTAHDT
jgi:hypothetical protein